ncbi:MAG: glutamate--cysteine ligase [Alphaproteobacteria bacterium]
MSVLLHESDEPLTERRQLVEYFTKAAKPKAEWLVGCEHEKFPYRLSTLKPVSYEEPNGLRDFLTAMKDFGWAPTMEGSHIIGLTRGQTAISFEPGGQVELAGAPLTTLHETSAEIDQHLSEVNEIGQAMDIGFLGIGFHPTATREDISWVPKARYAIMREYMKKRGKLGHDMMLRTSTVQVNLDFSDEADMIKKYRVSLALQPIATALFASSPFTEGKVNGFKSYRMHIWTDVDPDRSGPIPFVFDADFGFERYVDYALNVPMYFVWRDNKYIDCAGQSFNDFLAGKLSPLPGQLPTMNDWANHLTTLFPDVRLKKVLEMRGADAGSAEMLLALPSFWTGLLYDGGALNDAWDLVKGWSAEDRAKLYRDAPKLGFDAEIKGQKVSAIAQAAIKIAQIGLRRRAHRLHGGADETRYLDILFNFTESHQSRADQLLMQHEHFKGFGMKDVFDSCRLMPPPILKSEESL